MSEGNPHRHHFIPAFYTKRWAAADKKVCEFSKPYGNKAVLRRRQPQSTGFEDKLYSLRGFPPSHAEQVEERFFKIAVQRASDALDRLERPEGVLEEWPEVLRSGWSRFIVSLLLRHPSDIAGLRDHWAATFSNTNPASEEEYAKRRRSDQPATFHEFLRTMPEAEIERHLFDAYVPLVDNVRIGSTLNRMLWNIVSTNIALYMSF